MIPMLDIPRLHGPFQKELEEAFVTLSRSGQYINGPAIAEFEKNLSSYTGARHSVATSSGTDALLCALMAMEVKPGDEVITTAYSFIATAGCIARLGAVPVFVDVQQENFNIDPTAIEAAVTSKTVGIVPVHLFGNCANMQAISDIAKKHGLFVLEDAAQAIGARHSGSPVGSLGNCAIFSFFPAKNLGALGDAGAIITNDSTLYDKLCLFRSHGAIKKYVHQYIGGNFRMDTLQAAFLNIKLLHLDEWTNKRRQVAALYEQYFKGCNSFITPFEGKNYHVYNQYVLKITNGKRNTVKEALKKENIGCAIYYKIPLYLQPCFEYLGYKKEDMPVCEKYCQQNLALPVDPNLEEAQIEKIANTVLKAVES